MSVKLVFIRILVLHRYHIGEPSSSVNELLINTKVVADHSLGHVDTYLYFNLNSPQISDLNLRFLVQSHLNNNNDKISNNTTTADKYQITSH